MKGLDKGSAVHDSASVTSGERAIPRDMKISFHVSDTDCICSAYFARKGCVHMVSSFARYTLLVYGETHREGRWSAMIVAWGVKALHAKETPATPPRAH